MQQNRRTGCWVCRQRKLKCDSLAPNPCANCAKRGVECRYGDPNTHGRTIPSRQVTEAGIPRDRAQRACTNCATQKLKCSGDEDGCQRCAQNELICQYPERKRASRQRAGCSQVPPASRRLRQLSVVDDQFNDSEQDSQDFQEQGLGLDTVSPKDFSITTHQTHQNHQTHQTHQTSVQKASSLSYELRCTKDIIRQLVDAYFEYVYPITTHGFLHQGSFLEDLDQDRAPVMLVKAIGVSASQYVSPTTITTKQIIQWAHEVDAYIMNNLGTFSIHNLQILIIWANHHHSNGDNGKTWMLHGLTTRLAYCLQINVDSTIGSASEIECRRRMMWSIRILDRLLAGTVEEFALCLKCPDNLKLPYDEHFYLAEMPVETDTLKGFVGSTQIPNIGGFAGLIGIIDIWREILLFMRDLSLDPTPVGNIIVQVFALRQKLSDFEHQLPSNLKFVNRNLYLHANSAQRMTFIMLRSWWHECNTIIYRFTLPGFRESIDLTSQNASFVEQCQQQAFESAVAQSRFWQSITKMDHELLFDPIIMVLVHSNTRTLLAYRKLKVTNEWEERHPETDDIATLLSSNVSFLDDLAKRFPKVALGQREIRNLVQKNGFQASSEATLCEGLPLKRRHSRQDLIDEKERQERQERTKKIQAQKVGRNKDIPSFTDSNIIVPPAGHPSDATSIASMSKSSGLDVYMQTPTNPESSNPFESRHQTKARPEMFQHLGWRETDSGQFRQLLGEEMNAPFLGMYEDDFIGTLGYVAPFETTTQDDMLAAAGLLGNHDHSYDLNHTLIP